MEIIPHRDPFLMIDEVTEIEFGKNGTAIKNVTGDEYFFKGHFPDYPVMPGVLIVEALAQTGAVVVLGLEENRGKIAFFAAANDIRFKEKVFPKDVLELKVELLRMKMGIGIAKGTAYVNGKVACSAEIKFAIQNS